MKLTILFSILLLLMALKWYFDRIWRVKYIMIYKSSLFLIGLLFMSCGHSKKEAHVFVNNGLTVVDSASTGTELLNGLGQYIIT